MSWRVERAGGSATRAHDEAAGLIGGGAAAVRTIRIVEIERPAVVLGSLQRADEVDADEAQRRGLEVARRRSGGGAVLAGPGELLWCDVVVPAGDPLWSDDVARATWWLGECWSDALGTAGIPDARVWRQGLVRTPWSNRVCFAGVGPGEVLVGGAKMVGVSQRRTRNGALFQCGALLRWRPADLVAVLRLPDSARREAAGQLAGVAAGAGDHLRSRLIDAFVDAVDTLAG